MVSPGREEAGPHLRCSPPGKDSPNFLWPQGGNNITVVYIFVCIVIFYYYDFVETCFFECNFESEKQVKKLFKKLNYPALCE